ncbi:1-(5-phosphoribosyl)-5-[(5-phosphoribosylamino)methylideneamino]imidazole-4-carboxamide isomerase [Pantoea sp. Mhis]|uniref:1-(5-phosphoribosyl)-5-[(5- phosphoribosylamino)methylideneamino]imidazole-4- carboxamide isomerase n=1 Tax=Pantoea sp. Mhis TaxID=2576759 RepID=UPI00135CEDDD|nr:1-(5-phosphoribosyl)-5-[(5-phosphoribosylamino)methylideneamino]imidazole-4-carboxamide isomerase [Pantoea sp. Mhis]MXP56160.1 1-(5-phosphoribosyl)-5-[(5-phosphoribosylamino)methylideneamino]imidazole-4-carboxamide isomerase [Pantoea sp. Mhis]
MIIPSLDLIDGKVVRLYQGNYNQQCNYGNNPLLYLKNYKIQGAKMLHIADLSGAKFPKKRQIYLLKDILQDIKIPIQIGGGLRSSNEISSLLAAGATRVIIGSSAIQTREETKRWFHKFGPEAIVLALDIRINANNDKKIAIDGWQKTVDFTLEEIIKLYQPLGLKYVLCTDISRDGTLNGANVKLYQEISNIFPNISFQASGGIGTLNDIAALRGSGVKDVIIGTALLKGKFTLSEAIECWQKG